jgi:hypothetical protein
MLEEPKSSKSLKIILENEGDENKAERKLKSMFINLDDLLNEDIVDTIVLLFLYGPGIGDDMTEISTSLY